MRQLILDTETTGLDPRDGHRIIEFAALEVIDRKLTGEKLHFYINPECKISSEATAIHGITNEQVKHAPIFSAVVDAIVNYIGDSELIIHNAKFDINFLDFQFKLLGLQTVDKYIIGVIDTLALARKKFPNTKNSLDALCDRFKINREHRGFHGALIDCRLLFDVYLALTRQQISLDGLEDFVENKNMKFDTIKRNSIIQQKNTLTKEDEELHNNILHKIQIKSNKNCNWLNISKK